MRKLTVLSRSYCHLCDDLIAALEQFRGRFSSTFEIDVIDIDALPELEEKWGDKVPVLMEGEDEICHYYLDPGALTRHLAA